MKYFSSIFFLAFVFAQATWAQNLTFDVGTDSGFPGDTVDILITVTDFTNISGYQGTISFDSSKLVFNGLSSPNAGLGNFFGNPGQGLIPLNKATFSWVDFSGGSSSRPNGTPVIEISFVIKSGVNPGVAPVALDSSVTLLAYTQGTGLLSPIANPGAVSINPCTNTPDPGFLFVSATCKSGFNPQAIITGDLGGTFSVNNGASIDPTTGILDLSTTTAGTTYEVSYAVGSPCTGSSTRSILVLADDDASFTYEDTVCVNASNPVATNVALPGGSFSVNNASINGTTGELNLNTTLGGTSYIISYQTNGSCPNTSTREIFVKDTLDASFSFPARICPGGSNPVASILGDTGGFFDILPISASIDPLTGELDLFTTQNGETYTIAYFFLDECQSFSEKIVRVEDFSPPEVLCQDLTITLDSTGIAVLMPAQADAGSNDTCGIEGLALSKDTFDLNDIGTQQVFLIATDETGNTDSCAFNLTVQEMATSNQELLTTTFKVMPNPVKDFIQVSFENNWKGEVEMAIMDLYGKVVYREDLIKQQDQLETRVPMASYPAGIYMLRLSQNGRSLIKKIVKQ